MREVRVTKEDFSELKSIVKELAEAQKETQKGVGRLDRTMQELAVAQKRTEEEMRNLAIGLNRTREDLGGLSRCFSYAFENEAYRVLHKILKERYAIEVKDKVIRADKGKILGDILSPVAPIEDWNCA